MNCILSLNCSWCLAGFGVTISSYPHLTPCWTTCSSLGATRSALASYLHKLRQILAVLRKITWICNPLSGFEEFDFNVGGVLLFINTFGTEIVAAFALPLAAAAVAMKAPEARLGPGRDHGGEEGREEGQSTGAKPPGALSDRRRLEVDSHAGENGLGVLYMGAPGGKDVYIEGVSGSEIHDREHSSISEFVSVMDRMSGVILLLSGARTFLSAANVSVQRGHLMLWAIFAPKFIFDATMQVVSGGAAIVVWAVLAASLGAISSGNLGGRHRNRRASRGGGDTHAVSDDARRKLDNESDDAAVLDSPWHPSTSASGASTVESAPSMRLRRV